MQQIIYHLTDNDAYTFSCQYYVLQKYPRAEVEYTFFDRNNTVYPKRFGELVKEQLGMMPRVMITDEEVQFMKRRMYYLPEWRRAICTFPYAASGIPPSCGRCRYSPSCPN